jgi:hypothetical protein
LLKRENDMKIKLRPFCKEITKSMIPQEREKDRAVALYQHQQERNITTAVLFLLLLLFFAVAPN